MDEKELKLTQDEFRTTRDSLVSLSTQRMFEFENRENRLLERKYTSLIAFSSLSVAMVAIVFPLYINKEAVDCLAITSMILLLVSALYGIGLIIFSDVKERAQNKLQNDVEQKFLNRQLNEVVGIYSQAIDGALEEKHIKDYWDIKEETKKTYGQEIEPITRHNSLFDKLYYLYLTLFSFGFLLFVVSVGIVII